MRTLLSCTLAVSMYLPCTNVYATDTVDNLEKKTNELSSELSKVNEELSTLSSELDSTISKVESTTNAIELTKVSLADAQAKEVQQYSDMKLRIKYIYEAGDLSFLELLFSAEDMTDLLNKADFIQNISSYDRKMLDELHNTKVEIQKQQTLLEDEKDALVTLQTQMDQKCNDLQAKLLQQALSLIIILISWHVQKPLPKHRPKRLLPKKPLLLKKLLPNNSKHSVIAKNGIKTIKILSGSYRRGFYYYICSYNHSLKKQTMKKFTYLLAVAAVFTACNSGNNGYTVTGTVEGAADGDTVYLETVEGRQFVKLDSAVIKDGTFTFKGTQDTAVNRYISYKAEGKDGAASTSSWKRQD